MSEWDDLRKIAILSNQGKTKEAIEFCVTVDLSGRLGNVAMNVAELTLSFIHENADIIERLISKIDEQSLDFRGEIRFEYMKELLKESKARGEK